MDNGELYEPHYRRTPRLLLQIARLQVQEDLQGELQVSPAVHFTESLCACDEQCYGNELPVTARPDTNSGLHYIPTYMYRGQLSWIQIRSYTYSLLEEVNHSYCFSNCRPT